MSKSDQQEAAPLTRKQLRELRLTGSLPLVADAAAEAGASAKQVNPAPLPRAAGPAPVSPAPDPDASVDLNASPLTRRQARAQEKLRTASIPVITPEQAAEHAAKLNSQVPDADASTEPEPAAEPPAEPTTRSRVAGFFARKRATVEGEHGEHEHDQQGPGDHEADEVVVAEAASAADEISNGRAVDSEAGGSEAEPVVLLDADVSEAVADAADDSVDEQTEQTLDEETAQPVSGFAAAGTEVSSASADTDAGRADSAEVADDASDVDVSDADAAVSFQPMSANQAHALETDGDDAREADHDDARETDGDDARETDHDDTGLSGGDEDRPVVSSAFGVGVLRDQQTSPVSSFDALIVDSDTTGSQHIAPSALIFNEVPGAGSLTGPVTSTGELMITGTYEFPRGVGSQGHALGARDGKDVDAALIDHELAPTDSPTPIAASSAISTIKPAGEVIRQPTPEKGNKLMMSLAITAGGLALALTAALVVAFATGVF